MYQASIQLNSKDDWDKLDRLCNKRGETRAIVVRNLINKMIDAYEVLDHR